MSRYHTGGRVADALGWPLLVQRLRVVATVEPRLSTAATSQRLRELLLNAPTPSQQVIRRITGNVDTCYYFNFILNEWVNENIYYLRTYGLGANRNIIIIGKR